MSARTPPARAGLRAELVRTGLSGAALQLAGTGAWLLCGVVLARVLGPQGYGTYSTVFALLSLMVVPAQFGLPSLVVRETARCEASGNWGGLRGLWRWAGAAALAFSLVLSAAGAGLSVLFRENFTAESLRTFAWGLAFVPLLALGNLRSAALQGLRKPVLGQLPEALVRPALFLALIAGASISGHTPGPSQAMAFNVAAAAAALALGAFLLARARPAALARRPAPRYDARTWLGAALPLTLLSALTLATTHIGILMLGALGVSAQDIGVYRVAAQAAALASFGLSAIVTVAQPHFARLHAQGDMARFQKLATALARASLAFALAAALAAFAFGRDILAAVFGPGYATGYPVLVTLVCAQLAHAGFGTVGPLLNMTGNERDTVRATLASAAAGVALSAALIPLYGTMGAAVASAVALIALKLALWSLVRRRLGIDSSVAGLALREAR